VGGISFYTVGTVGRGPARIFAAGTPRRACRGRRTAQARENPAKVRRTAAGRFLSWAKRAQAAFFVFWVVEAAAPAPFQTRRPAAVQSGELYG